MTRLDLNCDLGEGEPSARTRALLRHVTSINLAAGGHAGGVATMERVLRWAGERRLRVGAHPGLAGSFGRGEVRVTPQELATLLLHQVGALHRLATVQRVRLHHVKLHGSLYHAVEVDPALGRVYLDVMARWFPGVRIYCRAGGRLAGRARRAGVPAWEEAFVDRAYRDDGTLVPRDEPNAVLTDLPGARQRWLDLQAGRGLLSVNGRRLDLRPQTVCIHGDTPGALSLLRLLSSLAR